MAKRGSTDITRNKQMEFDELLKGRQVNQDGRYFPAGFTQEDIEAFYDLQYWSMKYQFYAKDNVEYFRIRKLYVEKLGSERVGKIERLFISSPDYTCLLRQNGLESSVVR